MLEHFDLPKDLKLQNLLWLLMHIKIYAIEKFLASYLKVDEKTFWKWLKFVRMHLSALLDKQVSEKAFFILYYLIKITAL